jgi:hypothetical protein
MKKCVSIKFLLLIAMATFFSSAFVRAETPVAAGKVAQPAPTLTTVKGSVVEIHKLTREKQDDPGFEMIVHAKEGDYRVLLGPTFQKRKAEREEFVQGDQVMLVGFSLSFDGKRRTFQAQDIQKVTK